ncbi:regulator of competence-specific genes [Izhakiella capsodis]|uniref:Regulator of competence-specific genes n=2 Tax=Izhakiella capsodis TaxID=1367852 RepID=A0A1I4UPM9_9GAMM|nr:regulator of competence-specific genes [Izhakiella capsodis]
MIKKGRIESITQLLDPLGAIKVRTQFGGYSLSVGKAVFAVVSQGELYLRACEASKPYLCERKLQTLQLQKRGVPVRLDYYRVNETLWREPEQLLAISRLCLQGAREHNEQSKQARGMRDLPNIGHQLERLLREAGIGSVNMLRAQGAKASWLKLRALNKHLGLNTLYALEGALSGFYYQALPGEVKAELRSWYETKIAQLERERCR